MNELQNLYDVLVREGKYTKSFEEFQLQFQDEGYQNKVFDSVSASGLYTKDATSFKSKYVGKTQGAAATDVAVAPQLVSDDTELASEVTSSESQKPVNWFDQTWLGRGIAAASTTGEATDLFLEGSNVSMESVQEFIKAKEGEARTHVPSERMQRFQEQYQKEGKTWTSFFRNLKKEPALMAELFVQSLGTQIGTAMDSPEALAAAGTGAAAGAGATAYLGYGAAVGGIAGAMGGLATSMETALTMGELIQEELDKDGKEFTDENVLELLQGPRGKEIRNKSLGRGLTIGAVEALTGGLASKATTGVLKAGTRAAGRVKKLGAAAVGTGIEAVGGGLGEVGGRLAAGQEMDPAEIGFEAITGTVTAPATVGYALASHKKPTYKLNGEDVTYGEMKDFVDTATDMEIATANIKMENDQTGLGQKATKKQNAAIQDSQIDERITDKKDRETLIDLEQQRVEKLRDAEKKGINKVPNAGEELATIEAEIDAIVNKYEGAVGIGETKTAQEIAKTRRDISISDTIEFAETQGKLIGKDVKIVDDNAGAQAAYDAIAKANNLEAKNVADSDGFIVGDSIIINKDVAGRTGAISVGSHEILHGVMAKHLKSLVKDIKDKDGKVIGQDKTELKNLISSFKDVLSKKQYAAVEKRLIDNYSDIEGFDIETTDEWFTAFSDAIEKNEITFDEGVFNKIKNLIQEVARKFGFKKDFENGRQAYNFLKDYSKSIKKNKLSSRALALAGEGAPVEFAASRSKAVDAANKIEQNIKSKILAKGKKYDKQNLQRDDRGFGEIYNLLQPDGAISNYIKSLPMSPEKKQETIDAVTDRLINYDPQAQRKTDSGEPITLGEFMMANVGYGKLVAAEELYKKSEKKAQEVEGDAPVEGGQTQMEKIAETVADKEVEVELTQEEQYSQFRQDLGLDEAMMTKVRNAVIKTFGTKLPEVSSKKFRAALEKAYRTELKKPIQDMIGSRDAFNEFLGKDYKTVFGKLPVETLIQMERNVDPEQRIFTTSRRITKPTEVDELVAKGKLPKDVNRLSGPLLITKLPYPGIKKVMAFYRGENMSKVLGYEVGASTLGTRKDKLAMEMGVELGFDATMETIQTPEVAERRADIANLQGREQAGNEVSIIAKQIDRDPNIKFSISSQEFTDQSMSLVDDIIDNGVESVYNVDTGVILPEHSEVDSDVAKFVYDKLWSAGIIVESKGVRFKMAIAKSKIVPDSIKKLFKNDGRLRYNDKALNKLHKDSSVVAKLLGPEVMGVIDYEILGYKNRVMDSAKEKTDGSKGKFYDRLQKLKEKVKNTIGTTLPVDLDLSAVSMMNKNAGVKSVFGKVEKILFEDISRKKKLEKLAKLQPEIDAANRANILLAKHIAKVLIKAVRSGEVSAVSALHILQAQTSIVFGFRGLSRLDLITVLDGSQKPGENHPHYKRIFKELSKTMPKDKARVEAIKLTGTKGEHLAPNSNTMLEIAELLFGSENDIEIDAKLNEVFAGHSQMHTTKHLTGVMDKKGGANNDTNFHRVKFLDKQDVNTTVSADGKPYLKVLAEAELRTELNKTVDKVKRKANTNKELNNAIKASRTTGDPKGITVLDFDDTLATSKSLVKYTTPEGKTGTLNAEQFASTYQDLQDQGYIFDFSDFNKVVKGKLAPLFNKAMKLQSKFGPENMFVLTARPPQAQKAIFDFLKANGLNIPLKNITGLGNSTAEAKALWIADKVGEGFNDFYFADDALQNVQAVKNMLDQFDVKSKVQQAKVKFSKTMNTEFNNILEDVTGIESEKRFSAIKGRKRGESKGKFRFFVPPSHEDFVGLLYNFMGKGKEGDKHRDFFEKALVRPLNRANREYDTARQSVANDYKELNKQFKDVREKLTKKTPDGDFTFQDAIRVYLWDKHGHKIPGLTETDQTKLTELVKSDPQLQAYAETLNVISKQETYVNPTEGWNSGDIRMDLDDATGRVGRKQFFAEFIENADVIFSEENLNKIEAGYGKGVRESLDDMLYRIKTGRNRPSGQNAQVNKLMNYLNGSVGTVMFFNMRSALLQQMSIVNYINFADNNIFAAAKAFANQKQYWSDWAMIFNSDMLKQRRGGIQTDVNGAELAASLRNSKDITRKLISKLLELGFLPTQIGDNIAIATGGATYYRNRVNTYLKQGLSQTEAEAKAFTDFQDITQSTQQSARPDMVSKQQASVIGKVILNFQNVTSQFNRLGKKAFQDIYNRRITKPNTTQMQSDISNAARITYYFAVQNAIFYTLQTALFAMMFDDDEEDNNNLFLKKRERLINGSIDSVLRGTGLIGGVISTLKNVAIAFARQRDVKYNPDESAVMLEALNLSPVLGIKGRKIVNAEKTLNYNKKVIDEMETFDIDNPQWSAVTNYTEAFTNVPLNRLYNKTQNVRQALNNDHANWERTLMFLGWSQYNLDLENKKMEEIKEKTKDKKKKKSSKKRKPLSRGRR